MEDELFVEDRLDKISEAEAVYCLRQAWKTLYQNEPSIDSLAILFAQTALETGRFSKGFHCFNVGNIKRIQGQPWTMFRCNEILNGKTVWFDPPHKQTHFKAYQTPLEGFIDYLGFLSQRTRYKSAWEQVKLGSPLEYCKQLKAAGYFTASLDLYSRGVIKLTEEFKKREKELLSFQPSEPKEIGTIQLIAPEISFPPEDLPDNKNIPLPLDPIGSTIVFFKKLLGS